MTRYFAIGLCAAALVLAQRAAADSVTSDVVVVNGVQTIIPEPPPGGSETPPAQHVFVGYAARGSFLSDVELTEPGDPSYISDEIFTADDNSSPTGMSFFFNSDDGTSLLPVFGAFVTASIPETGLPQDLSSYFPIRGGIFGDGGFNQVSVQSDIAPLPSSAVLGLSLLGSLGLIAVIRKRLAGN